MAYKSSSSEKFNASTYFDKLISLLQSSSQIVKNHSDFDDKNIPIYCIEKAIDSACKEWSKDSFNLPPLNCADGVNKEIVESWMNSAKIVHQLRNTLANTVCIGFLGTKKVPYEVVK